MASYYICQIPWQMILTTKRCFVEFLLRLSFGNYSFDIIIIHIHDALVMEKKIIHFLAMYGKSWPIT